MNVFRAACKILNHLAVRFPLQLGGVNYMDHVLSCQVCSLKQHYYNCVETFCFKTFFFFRRTFPLNLSLSGIFFITILKRNCRIKANNPYLQTVKVHNIKLCFLLNNPPHVLYNHFKLTMKQIQQNLRIFNQNKKSTKK